jgi:O-antigen/teichoic acid export membrane protein
MKYTLFLSILGVLLVIMHAQTIILLIYGETFLPATTALKILMMMSMVAYTNNLYYQSLLIFEQQRLLLYAIILGSVLNVMLNLLLIPKFGIEGSAIATLIGQMVYGLSFVLIATKKNIIHLFHQDVVSTLLGLACQSIICHCIFPWLLVLLYIQ